MKPNNRRANTPMIGVSLPVIDDMQLVKSVLSLPIDETFRSKLTALLPKLEPGKFGLLKTRTRDLLMRYALDQNLFARVKRKGQAGIRVFASGVTYEERRVKGTVFAEELVARFVPSKGGVMPTPPGRRVA